MQQLYPCLGLQALGSCAYNPAQPSPTYFTIGDAIAALAFTLAVQQLFKPTYQLRLRAYGLTVGHLAGVIFIWALFSIIAAMLPNLPIQHNQLLLYPIFWELAGGLLIGGSYAAVARISLTHAKITKRNLRSFIDTAATLLSSANDEERAELAGDLLRNNNVERLIKFANAWQDAEMRSANIEFERLAARGEKLTIIGRPQISAFYLFAHRRELESASAAGTFLRIMSDPDFCSVLVRRYSWLTVRLLNTLAEKHLYAREAEPFIREIARQAMIEDDSMMAKETGLSGFSSVPFLSEALFGNWHILHHYRPFGGLSDRDLADNSESCLRRLNSGSKMMLEIAVKGLDYWQAQYIYDVQTVYVGLCRQWGYARARSETSKGMAFLHLGILDLYKVVDESGGLSAERTRSLYARKDNSRHTNLCGYVAEIVYESLACVANRFEGPEDESWFHAVGIMLEVFPPYEGAPEGMSPTQQQIAIKLIEKLRDNINGFYPAISRVLVATLGPYDNLSTPKKTAYRLIKDAVYKELQRLHLLYEANPRKFSNYLPASVDFNAESNSLSHSYGDGEKRITDLGALQIDEIDLFDPRNWQLSCVASARN